MLFKNAVLAVVGLAATIAFAAPAPKANNIKAREARVTGLPCSKMGTCKRDVDLSAGDPSLWARQASSDDPPIVAREARVTGLPCPKMGTCKRDVESNDDPALGALPIPFHLPTIVAREARATGLPCFKSGTCKRDGEGSGDGGPTIVARDVDSSKGDPSLWARQDKSDVPHKDEVDTDEAYIFAKRED